jgi:hypothetical protein
LTANRIRQSVGLVADTSDVRLAARALGWMCVLPLLKRFVPLSRLVRLMSSSPHHDRARRDTTQRAARLVGALCRVRGGNCLERSLILFRFLGEAGAAPQLVVGVGKPDREYIGHVWVSVAGEPLLDSRADLDTYARVVVFGSDGRREDAAMYTR